MIRRVAVLGAGIGGQHVDGLLENTDRFAVHTVCDLDEARAAAEAERAGATVTTDIAAVIADPAVDIVDICLPPMMHVPVALDALAAGKHVVLEKPIAGSLVDVDRLVAAEAASPGRIFPVFQYRFGPAVRALAAFGAANLLGRPQVAALETHWTRGADYYAIAWRGTWAREMGGAVLSHAIHAHDLLTLAFGPVADVSAMLDTRINPIETEDCAAIAMRMENGALATSSITLGAADNRSRMRLVFEHLTAESDTLPYAPAEGTWTYTARDPARQAEVDAVLAALVPQPDRYAGYFGAIADTLDGEIGTAPTLDSGPKSLLPTLADGAASIELVSAIYHAHRTGARVPLPLDRSLPIAQSLTPPLETA